MTIKGILKTAGKALAAVAGVGALWLAIKPEENKDADTDDLLEDLPDLPEETEKTEETEEVTPEPEEEEKEEE